jgi:hypothetical protein
LMKELNLITRLALPLMTLQLNKWTSHIVT